MHWTLRSFRHLLPPTILALAPLGSAVAQRPEPAPRCDLVLAGGTVLDGTGKPGFTADLAIRDGRIVAIGDLGAVATGRRIDVGGLCVAPGFIDTHAHADAIAIRRPRAENFVAMGVTTIITGNCGNSMRDVGRHLSDLAKRRISVNYGSLIGHNTVRRAAMGTANRAPTAAELETMKELVDEAMRSGAMGLSTGLIYVPGTYAATEELIELARVAGRRGGLYASHMRNENDRVLEAIDEALRIGREAGVHVHLSHLKASGRKNWGRGKEIVARLAAARAAGARVTGDQYAYAASSTGIDVLFPTDALSVGRPEFARKLVEDGAFRAEMHAALLAKMDQTGFGDFAWCMVSYARHNAAAHGRSLRDCARLFFGADGRDEQARAAIKLFADSRGEARVSMVFRAMNEADVETIMRQPYVGVACDAGIRSAAGTDRPHPRGSGNNARVLGHFVRERGVLALPLAIHKMTALPAGVFGLRERGEIRIGFHADLTVFDPRTVRGRATYEQPRLAPAGIPYVLVNGTPVIDGGKHSGARPGAILRHASRPR